MAWIAACATLSPAWHTCRTLLGSRPGQGQAVASLLKRHPLVAHVSSVSHWQSGFLQGSGGMAVNIKSPRMILATSVLIVILQRQPGWEGHQ